VQKIERNLGIELLRIICMMCVIIQHIIGHGWIIQSLHPGTWKYEIVMTLHSLCVFGISCFAMISGYVGVRVRYRYSSIVLQWSKMWIYSVSILLLSSVASPGVISRSEWRAALFPTLHRTFWYFSAYLPCFMIAPMIRIAMRRMTFKQASLNTAIMIVMFSLLTNAFGTDAFYTEGGKNALWLVALYIIGAYFGWFEPHKKISRVALGGFVFAAIVVTALTQPVAQRLGIERLSRDFYLGSSVRAMSMAISMLLFFSELKVKHCKGLISWLGGASFGVYVLHEHPKIRYYAISKYSYLLTTLGNIEIVIGIVLTAAAIYLGCALVDGLRERIYCALHVKQKLQALENRLLGDIWID